MSDTTSRVIIGCDHAAVRLKDWVRSHLTERGNPVDDVGAFDEQSVDYPDYAGMVSSRVGTGEFTRGILLCGTGLGMSMAANRFPHVRAALCNDVFSAVMSRRHNDANILVLGGRVIGDVLAGAIVDAWMDTPFEGGRHQRRLDLFDSLETMVNKPSG